MEFKQSEWNGYKRLDFIFEDKNALVICPKTERADKKWLFKTEYFTAFPAFQLSMLERGYYVAHVDNTTRWCKSEDTDRQARFAQFLHDTLGLDNRCLAVGMSCGGMQAVYLAAKYPQYVAALYLDAPVMDLRSCPCGINNEKMYLEFVNAMGLTRDMLDDYEHPVDCLPCLSKPVFLVCGDSDTVVPYEQNGKHLSDYYKAHALPFEEVLKSGCDHHPHGLEDNTPIIEFTEKYY